MYNIFEEIKKNNIEFSHHESDLYIPKNEITEKIINNYEFKRNVTVFHNQITHNKWYDIPFAFDPFWEKCPTNKV